MFVYIPKLSGILLFSGNMSFFNIQAFFKKARTEPNDEDSIPKSTDQELPRASKRKLQLESFIQSSDEQEKVIEKLQEEKSKWIEDKAKLEKQLYYILDFTSEAPPQALPCPLSTRFSPH